MANSDADRIQQAIDLMGPDDKTDYVLVPEDHASKIGDQELEKILTGPEASAVVEIYRKYDTEAIDSRTRLNRFASAGNWLLFFAAAASSSIMALSVFEAQGGVKVAGSLEWRSAQRRASVSR